MGMAGSSGGLAVQVELLEAEARTLQEASAAIRTAATQVDEVAAAAEGLPGWRTSTALGRCAAAWGERLAALAADFDERAKRLRVTASNYRQTEADVSERFRAPLVAGMLGLGTGRGIG